MEESKAFRTLKELLISSKVMAHPDTSRPDAYDYPAGVILVQEHDASLEQLVEYISKQLSGSQLNWAIIEEEAFAVMHALMKLSLYLYGATFTIYTDHKSLKGHRYSSR